MITVSLTFYALSSSDRAFDGITSDKYLYFYLTSKELLVLSDSSYLKISFKNGKQIQKKWVKEKVDMTLKPKNFNNEQAS